MIPDLWRRQGSNLVVASWGPVWSPRQPPCVVTVAAHLRNNWRWWRCSFSSSIGFSILFRHNPFACFHRVSAHQKHIPLLPCFSFHHKDLTKHHSLFNTWYQPQSSDSNKNTDMAGRTRDVRTLLRCSSTTKCRHMISGMFSTDEETFQIFSSYTNFPLLIELSKRFLSTIHCFPETL